MERLVAGCHYARGGTFFDRFDVFKRRAYDAGLMKRVFDDSEEGAAFYRKAYERDKSPYVLQQGARIQDTDLVCPRNLFRRKIRSLRKGTTATQEATSVTLKLLRRVGENSARTRNRLFSGSECDFGDE